MKTSVFARALLPLALGLPAGRLPAQTVFQQTNLVSDIPGLAAHTDAHLVNPWGISFGATSPFWVSNNGTGTSTLYNSTGTPLALVVTIPGGGGSAGAPTGQVFNSRAGVGVFNGDAFLFASDTGAIAGWRGALGGTAEVLIDRSGTGASYFGVALGQVGGGDYLYAANFGQNTIDVFPHGGAPALPGTFTDPGLPAGYSPFNIQHLGGSLFVTYALQDAGGDEVKGPGLGIIDEYNLDGTLNRRFATGGVLNAPWGLAIAPTSFGQFSGRLLVGNFGDGTINAFNLGTATYAGTLLDITHTPIVNDGLWGITPGNGGSGGSKQKLYFAAGINNEQNGLFGVISAVPDSGSTLILLSLAGAVLYVTARGFKLTPRTSRTG